MTETEGGTRTERTDEGKAKGRKARRSRPSTLVDTVVVWAIGGGLLAGLFGLIGAIFALVAGQPAAVGVCVLASGLAFGLIANAVLRK